MTFEQSFTEVRKLVETFKEQEAYYLSPAYQEQAARRDFIDQFFIALGWDVLHRVQKNPYKQEVKIEQKPDQITQRRADYAFYIAPNFKEPRFFVEAKKPSRNLHNPNDYFQAVRYAWNAKHKLAFLTDFEELHILDARYKPNIGTVTQRGVKRYHYSDYANDETFREIYHLLSRNAVEEGALEDFADSLPLFKGRPTPGKLFSGTQAIDDAFLEDLDDMRTVLAKAFKKNNLDWDGMLLTEATQRTIDRLVMMRFLEDKFIEADRIVATLGQKNSVWDDFLKASRKLNAKYNGVVFKQHFIDQDSCAAPDERIFKDICDGLSHEGSPYDFNTIPIHILGSVYERFLGKVIVATPKQAKVEDRPEVKKAGGVTYTPQFIVQHIVQRTVGRLIEGKTPKQISSLRFADIACGSGSFLIAVFEQLIDYHSHWYQDHPQDAERDGCHNVDGQWILSLKQKRDILLNNIYGVDIDEQAVEITQFSLYLKLLDAETTASANEMQVLFKEKILPDLSSNIRIGNSLIGADILSGELFSSEEERTIFPFDFAGAFPHIFAPSPSKVGGVGFDAIIGNPPYVRQETLGRKMKSYFKESYLVAHGIADLYTYFIERGMSLLKSGGLFGYIVANKWMRANYGEPLRAWLKQQCIEEITDFGDLPVFKTVTTYPCLLFMKKDKPKPSFPVVQVKTLTFNSIEEYAKTNSYKVNQASLDDSGWSLTDERSQAVLEKIKAAGVPLVEYVNGKIYRGVLTGLNEAFVIDDDTRRKLIKEDSRSKELIKPFLAGKDIKRYEPLPEGRWLIFTRRGVNIKNYPAIEKHLLQFKESLMPKPKNWKGDKWKGRKPGSYKWYEIQDTIDYWEEFEKPKIIYPNICKRPEFTTTSQSMYSNQKTFIIQTTDLYLLGLLNSRLTLFLFEQILPKLRGGFFEPSFVYFSKFPIRMIDPTNNEDSSARKKIIDLVQQMLDTKKQLAESVSNRDTSFFTTKAATHDRQIDALVYELYGLTEEEIRVVEGV